jgi:hypothetical protein
VTSAKHKVLGFPTIIAISHDGKISRFNDLRTAEKLLEFGNRQAAVPAPEQIEIVVHQPTAEVHQVPPSIKPVSEAPDALVL